MSQTSFLETVVDWDIEQCQKNLNDALPKLITQLHKTESIHEEVGILKLICQSFLPCVDPHEVERNVFSQINEKSCHMWDGTMVSIREMVSQAVFQQDILTLLQIQMEILDCINSCIQAVLKADNSVSVNQVHSLPYGAVHLLKGSYQHCKDSSEVYGDKLANVAEPLSHLFKKAHSLQVSFISLLEKIPLEFSNTEQDIQDLCYIGQGLFEVCKIVTALDVKLMCSVWKTISRFCVRMKEAVKHDLDIDSMICHLCSEVTEGYLYLFQLAPPQLDSQDLALSQGDVAAFQHSVKVLGYQMRILVSLLDSFCDTISTCETSIVTLLLLLLRNMPPNLSAPNISSNHVDEIRRQILVAMDPILSAVIGNQRFMDDFTRSDRAIPEEERLPYLLILVKIVDILPKQSGDIMDRWLTTSKYSEDVEREGILALVFKATQKCYVELSLPVYLPGVMCAGKPQSMLNLYEYVTVHVCGFIGSFPARHFHIMEEVLLSNILMDRHIYSAMLAMDTWCFLARYGTADLCHHHLRLLLDLCVELPCYHTAYHLHWLVHRLIKFSEPDHQADLLKRYPPSTHLKVWTVLLLPLLPLTPVVKDTLEQLVIVCVQNLHNFINNSSKRYCDMELLSVSLSCLKNVYQPSCSLGNQLSLVSQRNVVQAVMEMWSSLGSLDWTTGPRILHQCLADLLDITGSLLSQLQNTDILSLFDMVTNLLSDCDDKCRLAATQFLLQCGKIQFPPSAQQPQILTRLAELFERVLCNSSCVVRQAALESFTKFAEQTVHETVVPDCMNRQSSLQDTVVAFLNKSSYETPGYSAETYLRQQRSQLDSLTDQPELDTALPGQQSPPQQPASKKIRTEESNEPKLEEMIGSMERSLTNVENSARQTPLSPRVTTHLHDILSRLQHLLLEPE